MQGVPHPGRLPVPQAPPAGYATATAHLGRQHLPGDAGLEHKDDPGQGGAVGDAWSATLGLGCLRRQQRGDESPQFVADKRLAHGASVPCHDQVLKGALSAGLRRARLAGAVADPPGVAPIERGGVRRADGPVQSVAPRPRGADGAADDAPRHLGPERRGHRRSGGGLGAGPARARGRRLMRSPRALVVLARRVGCYPGGG